MVHNSSSSSVPPPPRNSVVEASGTSSWSGMPLAIPISSQGGLPGGLQPLLPPSAPLHSLTASNNASVSLARQRQPRPPPSQQQSRPSAVSTNSLAVGRNVERVLEDCAHTGRLNLSGRGMKDLVYPSCNKYNLIDTITADISRNRLSEFPSSLLDLVFLERLDCRENLIKSVPDDIVRLRCLVHLDLSRNLITALPAVICKLPALEILLISHNRLTALPQEIGSLVSLMELDASANQLTHLPASLSRLSRLRALDLRKNQLQALPTDFADLRLVRLDMSQNRFSALPTSLRSMSTLECLQIADNPLEYPPVQVCNRGQIHIFKCLEKSGSKGVAYVNGEQRRQGRSEDGSRDRRDASSNRSVEREHGGYASPASLIPVPVPFNKHVILNRDLTGSALNGLAQRKLQTMGSSLDQAGPGPDRPTNNSPAAPQRALSLELPSLAPHDAMNDNRNGMEAVTPERNKDTADGKQTRIEAPLEHAVVAAERLLAVEPDLAGLVMVDADGSPEATAAERPVEVSATKRTDATATSTKVDELNSNGIVHKKAPVAASQIPRKISPGQPGANGRSPGKGTVKGAVGSVRPRTGSNSGSASGAASTSSSQSSHALSTPRDALTHAESKGARAKEHEAKSSSPAVTPHAQSSPLPDKDKDSPTPRSEQTSLKTKVPLAKSSRSVTKQKSVGQSQTGSDSSAAVASAGARKTSWPSGSTATMPPAAGGSGKVHGAGSSASEYNPTFTIRRQQEQIREEGEKLEVLRKYLESRLKLRLPEDLLGALQDGVILCHLVNHIRPRSVISIHVPSPAQTPSGGGSGGAGALPKLTPAKCRRNVENFLDACRRLGLSEVILCAPADILEGKNVGRVVDCVQGLNLLEGSVSKRSVQVASSFSLVYSSAAVAGGVSSSASAAGKRLSPAAKGAPADQQPVTAPNGISARVGSAGSSAPKKNTGPPVAANATPGFSVV